MLNKRTDRSISLHLLLLRVDVLYIKVMSNALELYAIIRLLNVNLPELREVRGVGSKEYPGHM
jgi:hypothetical protein